MGFTEFDILEKYRKSFHKSELGRLHSLFPFERMAKTIGPVGTATGTQEHLQSFGKDYPHGPEGVHRLLRQTAGGTSERQHTLSDVLQNHDRPVLAHNQLQDSQSHP